jgi:subtilisin family serine protease
MHADGLPGGDLHAGSNVTIALVDSGVNASHPALMNAVELTVRFTSGGETTQPGPSDAHGTHVAGILVGNGAESPDNRLHGMAPGSKLVSLDISQSFTTTNALRAFEWIHAHHADYGIRVVSNSWGRAQTPARWDPNDPVVRASSALVADGLVVVFSSGNNGPSPSSLTLEAMNPDVITVGATSKSGTLEAYSSRGPALDQNGNALPWAKPDVVAPGTDVFSTRFDPPADGQGEQAYYVSMSGTSMAAPMVAGEAAVLLGENPFLSPQAVKEILEKTASDGAGRADNASGYGLVDVGAAVQAALGLGSRTELTTTLTREPIHAQGTDDIAGHDVIAAPNTTENPLDPLPFLTAASSPSPPVSAEIRIPIADAGAQRVSIVFGWASGAATGVSFLANITDGATTFGPFGAGPGSITIETDLPQGGPWFLVASPQEGGGQVTWTVNGYAEYLATHAVQVAQLPPNLGAGAPADSFFEERERAEAITNVAGPGGLFSDVGVAGVLLVSGFVLLRARTWPRQGTAGEARLATPVPTPGPIAGPASAARAPRPPPGAD